MNPSNPTIKTIDTLVEDIYGVFGEDKVPSPELLDRLTDGIKEHITNALAKHESKRTLRGSGMGEQCDKKTWYEVHNPEAAEEFDGPTRFKFLLGHLFEEIVLYLAEESGHRVEGRQTEVDVDGVKGHIDAVIDGVLTDVKTTTVRGIGKFYGNGLHGDDPFGYLEQIEFYKEGLQDNEILEDKERYAFLGVSRERGEIALDVYPGTRRTGQQVRENVQRKLTVANSKSPPNRGFVSEPDGASGNRKLPMKCNYCQYKKDCWSDSNNGMGLRVFDYSGYPRYLTSVVKTPKVNEIT